MIKIYEQPEFCVTFCDGNTKSTDILKNKSNIVLLSGGIDSQSVYLYLKQKNIQVKTLFCDYKYNKYDADFAVKAGIDIKIHIDLDRFFFDKKRHLHYFDLYKCTSPQLAVHLEILEYIRQTYPESNIFMPGMPPFYNYNEDGSIGNSLPDYCQLVYYRYKEKTCFSNFHPYFWLEFDVFKEILNSNHQLNFDISDYDKKILLYKELGLKIIPQDFKKTGFEEYKLHLKKNKKIMFNDYLRTPINKNKKSVGIFSHNIFPEMLSRKINE